jgi:hypothetical protein
MDELTRADWMLIGLALDKFTDTMHAAALKAAKEGWRDEKEQDRVLTYLHQAKQASKKVKDIQRGDA